MKEYGTLHEIIEEVDDKYKESFELYPGAPLSRVGYMLGENLFLEYPRADKYYRAYLYVYALLSVDLIMKKDTCFYPDYILHIKKALELVLSHSRKMYLEPDEWTVMTEVAKRVKEKLPKMRLVPRGQEYKYFSYGTDIV